MATFGLVGGGVGGARFIRAPSGHPGTIRALWAPKSHLWDAVGTAIGTNTVIGLDFGSVVGFVPSAGLILCRERDFWPFGTAREPLRVPLVVFVPRAVQDASRRRDF